MSIKSSPLKGRFTSGYGARSLGFHAGVDVAPPVAGTVGGAVYAAEDGEVVVWVTGRKKGQGSGAGKVWAPGRSGNGFRYRDTGNGQYGGYNHMTPVSALRRVGARYKAGDVIGHLDTSGIQTGPHVHYERWRTSSYASHFDPVPSFTKAGIKLGDAPKKASKPAPSTTKYPAQKITGVAVADITSGWYRLLGALGYTGSTTVRVQKWLKASGHYKGAIDNKWGGMTTAALQRRLRGAHKTNSKVLDPGPDDGVRGTQTKRSEVSYLNHQINQARK